MDGCVVDSPVEAEQQHEYQFAFDETFTGMDVEDITEGKKLAPEGSYNWHEILSKTTVKAASVSSFPHVPFANSWKRLAIVTAKVEVELFEEGIVEPENGKPYWVATIKQFAGYKARIRYAGYKEKDKTDLWLNFATDLHPIGFCRRNGFSLIPPLNVYPTSKDWRLRLAQNLTGGVTISENHNESFQLQLRCSIPVGSYREVLDKTHVSRMRLAKVNSTIGQRVHVTYWNSENLSGVGADFWCHENSTTIYPMGWCRTVGHNIYAPDNYDPPTLSRQELEEHIGAKQWCLTKIDVGMRLEAVDPLNLSQICAATVMKVLNYDYFMIRIDSVKVKRKQDLFCYHITSPLIFQCGFCDSHGIHLQPPFDSKMKHMFDWDVYFAETNAVPLQIYREQYSTHGFEVGMKLEAVDVMTPNLIAVATIARTVGRLLQIHFDGWDESFDQWADAKSANLFPIGWCEAVGHPLEPPKAPEL